MPRAGPATWIPALALALVSGCGSKPSQDVAASVAQVRSEIATVIPDSARAQKISAAYSRLGTALTESAREQRVISSRFQELCRRYDAPRESLDALMSSQEDAARRFREQAMSVREEVRSLTSEKEWKALASGRKKLASLFVETER